MPLVTQLQSSRALPQLISSVPQIITAIISGLISALPTLWTMGPRMFNELWRGLMNQSWGQIGSDIIRGIVDGFSSAVRWVSSAVSNIGDKIKNGFKNFFGIHSPSALMRDEVGQYIGLGISEGIQGTDFMAGVPAMVNKAKSKINTALSGSFGIDAVGQSNAPYALQFTLPIYIDGNYATTQAISLSSEQLARANKNRMNALGAG